MWRQVFLGSVNVGGAWERLQEEVTGGVHRPTLRRKETLY